MRRNGSRKSRNRANGPSRLGVNLVATLMLLGAALVLLSPHAAADHWTHGGYLDSVPGQGNPSGECDLVGAALFDVYGVIEDSMTTTRPMVRSAHRASGPEPRRTVRRRASNGRPPCR